MTGYQDCFKRYEKKYLLSESQYRRLSVALMDHMKPDRYSKSLICNIYYDTPDRRLIRASLEKPVYKEKLRLRSYGLSDGESPVFLELKKKYRGVVYKRRVCLPLKEAEHFLQNDGSRLPSTQIEREISWTLSFYNLLEPACFLCYDRTALTGQEDPGLRVTFDSGILWREEALRLDAGVWGNPLLRPGQRLMEIKIPGAMPLWLCNLLDEQRLYTVSLSRPT